MAAAAIRESTLPVELPSREMNSLFVIFNQKCNFYWGISTFKGSLLSGALMLKWLLARNRLSPDFYGSQFGGCLYRRPFIVNFKGTKPPNGTCINRNTTFEPFSVQFGPQLRPVGRPRKRKKGGRRKSQNRYISPLFGGAISQPIFTKCGEFVDLINVITSAKFDYKIFIGFSRPRGRNRHFPLEIKRAI